jgi:hypothetical protein
MAVAGDIVTHTLVVRSAGPERQLAAETVLAAMSRGVMMMSATPSP